MRFLYIRFFFAVFICQNIYGQTYEANLLGSQAAYPTTSMGTGSTTATLSGNDLTITVNFENLAYDVLDLALKEGYAGEEGTFITALSLNLNPDGRSGTASTTQTLTNDQITALSRQALFIVVNTDSDWIEEIRGQLVLPGSDATYTANLFGSNAVPHVMTEGFGSVLVQRQGTSLTVSGSFDELSSNVATTGFPITLSVGLTGEVGNHTLTLTPTLDADGQGGTFDPTVNTFNISQNLIPQLEDRAIYAVIKTDNHPEGELRGQLAPPANIRYRAFLTGNTEIPIARTMATGRILVELMGDSIFLSGSFQDFESNFLSSLNNGAHIHEGYAGNRGPLAKILTPTILADQRSGRFMVSDNKYALTSDQLLKLQSRQFYINTHSVQYEHGEIRGQLLPESQYYLYAHFSGNNMVPPNPISVIADGAVYAEVMGNRVVFSGSFEGLQGPVNNVALNTGYAGASPSFIRTIFYDSTGTGGISGLISPEFNVAILNDLSLADLQQRFMNITVESTAYPGGELRGQLLQEAQAYFTAVFSGAEVYNDPYNTYAYGAVMAEVIGNQITFTGSFNELTDAFGSSFINIRNALAGSEGDIVATLFPFLGFNPAAGWIEAASNTYTWTDPLIDSLRNRQLYINIPTTSRPQGELRGQLLPIAGNYVSMRLDGIMPQQPTNSPATGYLNMEINKDFWEDSTEIIVSGSFDNLQELVNPFDGMVCFSGSVGEQGTPLFDLDYELDSDGLGGTLSGAQNRFVIHNDFGENFINNNAYVSIFTNNTNYPAGEIRGQALLMPNHFPEGQHLLQIPLENSILDITSNGDSTSLITWSTDIEPDNQPLNYVVQIALSNNFNTNELIWNASSETATEQTILHADLRDFFTNNGIEPDTPVYVRIISTDGCLKNYSDTLSYRILGDLAGITILSAQPYMRLFPNPAYQQIEIQWTSPAEQITITNTLGQTLKSLPISSQKSVNVELSQYSSGLYFVHLWRRGQIVNTQSFILK